MAPRSSPPAWIPALAIAAAVGVAYLPALHGGFIWDDDAHLTAPALRSLAGLGRIWTEPGATQQYYPLLHSLFWVEHRLWGDHALGYHLANLALHVLAACLAGRLLQRLAVPGAWLAAALFALHPVQVESVAWISEQKNTLSAVFYLGAALLWLRFDEQRQRRHYWCATALFVLGLLAKTIVATLPAAVLVVVWWRRGRIDGRRDVVPLLPWIALGATAGLFTATVERQLIGASGAAYALSLAERCVLAGRVVWFYAGKLAWPAGLTFLYPRWRIDATSAAQWLPLAGAVLATVALWWRRHAARGAFATWLIFIGTLFPVLGFFNVYPFIYSYVADHFQYLASLAPLALAAALLARSPAGRLAAIAAALTFGTLTWRQSHDYRDAETLYRVTLARNPESWMAWNNLGFLLLPDRAHLPEATACFERALTLRPDYPEALGNLGLALIQAGRPAAAVPCLQRSLQLKPGPYQMHNNLGIALATSGRPAEALTAFRTAAALNPTLPNIQENWAKALLLLGREREAAEHFATAARLRAAAH